MKPLICHLDCDCFYVSAERVRNPALRHVPCGVLGNQGACVIAKSYEMKAHGVTTGMPIWDAVKLCPQGVYLKRDFRWYGVLSRQLLELLKTVSPTVEFYSIDEMFFDANTLGEPLPEAAKALQQRILDEIGVPVSMGISHNRTLAKLVSDLAKPFGCRVLLDHAEIEAFLRSRTVDDISGVGSRNKLKLEAHGIKTCWDYAQADKVFIRQLMTIKGEEIWHELHGDSIAKIHTTRPKHKMLGRGGSMGEATTDRLRLEAWAARNTERLIEELDFHQVLCKRFSLAVSFKGGGGWSGRAYFVAPTASYHDLVSAAKDLLAVAVKAQAKINGMHLLAEELIDRRNQQLSLFPNAETPKMKAVAEVKHLINRQIGRFALRSGDTLPLDDIYADDASGYDICDIRGKVCF